MPVNSGAMPEAPLGAQTTRLVPVPVPVRAPDAERPLPVVAVPLEAGALDPREPPPPFPVELAAVPPPPAPAAVVAAPGVDVGVAELAGVEMALVADDRELVAVPVADGASVGSATAPPPAGKPLLVVALPTAPALDVAVCAVAGATNASVRISAETIRLMPAQRNSSVPVPRRYSAASRGGAAAGASCSAWRRRRTSVVHNCIRTLGRCCTNVWKRSR